MTLPRIVIATMVMCAAMPARAAPASAGLRLCNQTSYIVYTALGAATKTELDTRGWTRVVPGDCATPIADPLTAPAYFVYARTSQAHSGASRAWGGNVMICARDTNFFQKMKLPIHSCPGGDFYKMPFAVLDRHGKDAWTMTFSESTDLKTLKDAKRAGINRLLEDLGYHVNVPGDRARDLAIEDFRRRMKLPADATDADLFAALETQAMRAAAPAGYTACNDTGEALWVAIGLPSSKAAVSRGWWQISPGVCSRLMTQPLRTDRVYLLAQRKNKQPVVTGPAKLCVADIEFEIAGGPCRGKGRTQAGFATTNTKGRSGYVANISESGLLPPARTQAAGTPK
jgi:uncharacterized membrane protein